ncbi:MAG TPA: acyl-CoA dehydrogenase family protein [Burkholderiaceae bacterium]|nr:acyl-CoA dehydrogenase family protein [Burkholderiaceae bacterium]
MLDTAFETLLRELRVIAADVAATHAADVDARARFPQEAVDALRGARVLSCGVPGALGGAGCTLLQQAQLCAALAQGCSASGMVLAMHLIEVACLARHGLDSAWFRGVLEELVEHQHLIASVTSEVGTSGDTRSSVCAVERDGDRFRLEKAATTVSYGAHADALLVTARRAPDAAASDQVLVLLRRGDHTLTPTSSWDTLGMRGTCSPGGRLVAEADVRQIVPGSFADSSAQTMVPFSHVLWSALWWGIAADAMARAAAFVRGQARSNPGTMPPAALLLAQALGDLQALQQQWTASAAAFDALGDDTAAREALMSMGWALRLNHLKVQASEAAPRIVHQALQIIGVMGYRNDSKFSVGRHYRDTLSAALMISNERLAAKSAAMLLVVKDV